MKKFGMPSFLGLLAAGAFLLPAGAARATTYYVDSVNGQDSYDGTSSSHVSGTMMGPWKTVSNVQKAVLGAGDTVKFAKNSVFSTGLVIAQSGSATGNITFTSYGAGSAAPVFQKGSNDITSRTDFSNAIEVTGSYVTLDGLTAQTSRQYGVLLTGSHNKVTNCTLTDVGTGIYLSSSSYNTITNNTFVNLHMIKNVGKGDYGAVGVWLLDNSTNNEISDNVFNHCQAPESSANVADGGALELDSKVDNSNCTNNTFERNQVYDCIGVLEIGAEMDGYKGTVSNLTLRYNVCYRNDDFIVIHTQQDGSGVAQRRFANLQIYNNTVVEPNEFLRSGGNPVINYDPGFPDYHDITWHDNIFLIGDNYHYVAENFIATYYANDFYRVSTTTTYNGGSGALVVNTNNNVDKNPIFYYYNSTLGFSSQDFRLSGNSPVSGKGAYVSGGLVFH